VLKELKELKVLKVLEVHKVLKVLKELNVLKVLKMLKALKVLEVLKCSRCLRLGAPKSGKDAKNGSFDVFTNSFGFLALAFRSGAIFSFFVVLPAKCVMAHITQIALVPTVDTVLLSKITQAPISNQVGTTDTFSIEVVGTDVYTKGWWYSIYGNAFVSTTELLEYALFSSDTAVVIVKETNGI